MRNSDQSSGGEKILDIQVTDKLVWNDHIEPILKASEVEFIKERIGRELIEENEQLFRELEALVDIYRSYRLENTRNYDRKIDFIRTNMAHNTSHLSLVRSLLDELHSSYRGKTSELLEEHIAKNSREGNICELLSSYDPFGIITRIDSNTN